MDLWNLGLRWDDYSVEGADWVNVGTPAVPTLTPRSGDWDFVNYQVGLVYKPTANSSIYASPGHSTPPTISAGDQNNGNGLGTGNLGDRTAGPEETESFEIGAKANLFNDRLPSAAPCSRPCARTPRSRCPQASMSRPARPRFKASNWASRAMSPTSGRSSAATLMDPELTKGSTTTSMSARPSPIRPSTAPACSPPTA